MIKSFCTVLVMCLWVLPLQGANLKPYNGSDSTPPLKLVDLQGKTHNLDDYKGKIVLLQFWATYCTPCRKEMPSMNKLLRKMQGTPFEILAVDMGESKTEVQAFVDQVKPEFTILLDETGQSIAQWKVFAAPSNFIIDVQGKIRYTLYGGVEWDSPELISQLKALAN